ncbi:uncharacterized protein LOC124668402 [Lolium rigidum]|uniref:uncharacterized protein LOC124668402 n=1 Tax=Lolium rigidum TaxID=89674 RepID=UPI001F5C211A|nr:uncharacterized protein LOC124668402 [Lolium rigidum]
MYTKVVLDCTKRGFQNMLKEFFAGDVTMQVLMGQMRTTAAMASTTMNIISTADVKWPTLRILYDKQNFVFLPCKGVGSLCLNALHKQYLHSSVGVPVAAEIVELVMKP